MKSGKVESRIVGKVGKVGRVRKVGKVGRVGKRKVECKGGIVLVFARLFKRAIEFILCIVFPPKCIFCNTLLPLKTEIEICDRCYKSVPFIKGKVCSKCGQPIHTPYGPEQCIDCRKTFHYFEQGTSVFEYKGVVREALVRYKFFGKKRYSKTLGKLMAIELKEMKNWPIFDIIVYTPLYRKKLLTRGYNQAELLAKVIAKELGCSVGKNILCKTKDTLPQSTLSKYERRKNVKGAFAICAVQYFNNMNVLLVDDVYTTGATVNECARLLKKRHAKSVYVVTAAIGQGYI